MADARLKEQWKQTAAIRLSINRANGGRVAYSHLYPFDDDDDD